MNIFKNNKDNDEPKGMSVKPQLKKMYGRNYKLLSEISRNTRAIEDVAAQLKKLNEKIDVLIDKQN